MRDALAVDKWILLAVIGLLAMGVIMVLSTSYLYSQERYADGTFFFRKQLFAMGGGVIALIVCSLIPSHQYRRFAYPLLALTLVVLILVLIPGIGANRGGARRWIALAGFAFQPSELAKLAIVVYLAHSIAKKEPVMGTFSIGVLPHMIVTGVFAGVLLLEPDFGSALILTMLLYSMLFIGGVRVHHLLSTGLLALPLLIYIMTKADYRVRRLLSFLDPWSDPTGSGFHVIQSLIAFGSGQLWGRGLGESRQKLILLARGPYRFRLLGDRRGAGFARRLAGVGAVRRHYLARLAADFAHRRAVRSVFSVRLDRAFGAASVDSHGRGHGAHADQRIGIAVYQLWRLGDADQSGRGGHTAQPIAPESLAMRIVFAGGGTGGHLFPGLAVAQEFQRRDGKTEILFIGTEQGIEYRVLPKEGFKLETLTVKGLKGRGVRGLIDALYGVPAGLMRSLAILRGFRPDCVIGLGGYASGPVLLAAKLKRIRCAIMEQNLRPGFTNKLLARWVDRVFTAYRESEQYFPGARVLETGNPVRWTIVPQVKRSDKFTLLVFGGSAGARRINFAVIDALKLLDDLKNDIAITHQTGQLDYDAIKTGLRRATVRSGGNAVHRTDGRSLCRRRFGVVPRRRDDHRRAYGVRQGGDFGAISLCDLRSSAQ